MNEASQTIIYGYMDVSNDLKLVKIKGKQGLFGYFAFKTSQVDMSLAATIDGSVCIFKIAESTTTFLCYHGKNWSFPLLVFYTSSPTLSPLILTFSLVT
jgi:hypothetical protein